MTIQTSAINGFRSLLAVFSLVFPCLAQPINDATPVATVAASVPAPSSVSAQPARTWLGRLKKTSTGELVFVSGRETYAIRGLVVRELLKDAGKDVALSGALTSDGKEIEVFKSEPVLARR